jgi:Flp pilus assembly protein TadG
MTPRAFADDRGEGFIAAFIILLPVLLLAGAGLLIDGGRVMQARRHAGVVAFEAARAGAQAINVGQLRTSNITLDGADTAVKARTAGTALLAGIDGRVVSVDVRGDLVEVVVVERVGSWFPLLDDRTVTATAVVRVRSGVDTAEP